MIQGAIAGLAAGGLYAVIAVCLTLMVRLTRVVNFTVPAVGMFGAYFSVFAIDLGLPVWAAIVSGIVVGAVISGLIGLIIARWMPEADINRRSAVTVAALLLLISLAFIVYGNKPRMFPPLLTGPAFSVANVVITKVAVVMVLLAIAVAIATTLILRRSKVGVRLRALSERPTTAELLGVPVKTLSVSVWIGVGLVATFAISLVAPTQTSDPLALSLLIVQSSAAALLGAFRRVDLAVVGGLLLGALQGALAQYQHLTYVRDWLPLIVIVAFLLWT